MNLRPTLEKIYPQGSYQGQCFTYLHKLVDFPSVGNSLGSKVRSCMNFGLFLSQVDSIKVGDIILTNESFFFGHGALVNAIVDGKLQLSESNYSLNGRVNHSRLISPNSKAILGIFRANVRIGNWLFKWPPINYPIIKNVLIFQNNQPQWPSMIAHLGNLQKWFWQASGQRIQIVPYFTHTNLTGWDKVFTGPVIGGSNVEIIKESWFDANVLPLASQVLPGGVKADVIIFNMPRADWKGTVFDHPEQIELGYCYEKVGMTYPIKIMTVSDEHDDYWPYYPAPLSAFAKLVAHEMAHGLYGVALDTEKFGVGFDFTHNHFKGENGYPLNPDDCFKDFDYNKL